MTNLAAAFILAVALVACGFVGILARRNLMFVLMSLELMFAGGGLAFVAAGAHWGRPDGQIMFLLAITLAASEAAVGLALILRVERQLKTLDADRLSSLRG